jgi:hypothetical protein
VQLLWLLVQLRHWCRGKQFTKLKFVELKRFFSLLNWYCHIHWVATVPFKVMKSTEIQHVHMSCGTSVVVCKAEQETKNIKKLKTGKYRESRQLGNK